MDTLNSSSSVLSAFLRELASPLALRIDEFIARGDYGSVLGINPVDPRHYSDALSYFKDAQAAGLVKKVENLVVPGIDRKASALKKWESGERECYWTNERLSPYLHGGNVAGDGGIYSFLEEVRKIIVEWVGHSPPDLDKVEGKLGPGATFADQAPLTTAPDKFSSASTITLGAKWYILPFLQTFWGRLSTDRSDLWGPSRGHLSWVRGNRFSTAPKTALTDRAIAIEPAVNVFYQLGLGSAIRRRLKNNAGWDLDSAQDVHRREAAKSSVTQEYCTLDLSNASDTVCTNLVKLVMPPRWTDELMALRSPFTQVDGKWRRLEKFSSMGNGFTFELETLIFAALCSASLRRCGYQGLLGRDMFIFGDDIIVPDAMARGVTAVLQFFGFSLNKEKSFSGSVKFRESCGADYFDGADVRPFNIKEFVNDPGELFPTYNGLKKTYDRLDVLGCPTPRKALHALLGVMPIELRRCHGPELLGDCVLHEDDESKWRFKWEHNIRYFRGLIRVPTVIPWSHWRPEVTLASALYGVGEGFKARKSHEYDGRVGVTPRDSPFSYAVKWIPCS